MAILVLAEYDASGLRAETAKTVTAARQFAGHDIHLLVAGSADPDILNAAARIEGVTQVLNIAGPVATVEPLADLLVTLLADYDAAMAAASSLGKSVMPRVAARLDVMQISDVIEIAGDDVFKRPVYAGNAIVTVKSSDPKKILTIRTTAFAAAPTQADAAPIRQIAAPPEWTTTRLVSQSLTKRERPQLSSARIVVSGGRAFGGKEQFDALLTPLADKLGAAIGASRAAVDAGYAANELQVGQTGQVVAPDLYIACGISGAIQHIAGMRQSKIIVAINSDPEAPIFKLADFGLVGDLFELLPELTKAL